MAKPEELLKLLDMSEDEQKEWCVLYTNMRLYEFPDTFAESLADLAFRLRDEAVVKYGDLVWHKAVVKICGYMWKETAWFKNYGKPIHWIIAALIAKGDK